MAHHEAERVGVFVVNLVGLAWVSIGNGDQSALHMEAFGTAYQYVVSEFILPFFQNGYYRFGFLIAFAIMASLTIRFFGWFKDRVW